MVWWVWSGLLLVALLYVCLTPFTKVEESFNLQAIHDLLVHRTDLSAYDHKEFPGVVPRTFIAPIAVALPSFPLHVTSQLLGGSKFASQLIARAVIAVFGVLSLNLFLETVTRVFGKDITTRITIITISQFHFLFYLSRPLPNTFALSVVLVSYHFLLKRKFVSFIWSSAFAILVLRSELAVLLGLFLLVEVIDFRVSMVTVLVHGFAALVTWLSLTVAVDSVFWGRLIWPEGEVFYFNAILNKSSEWGTLPLHAYFTNLLPKAVGPLVPPMLAVALYFDARVRRLTMPVVAYIMLYSLLPHKELRFVLYSVPVLNLGAARGWAHFAHNWAKGWLYRVSWVAVVGLLLGNVALTGVATLASSENYFGGEALARLHRFIPPSTPVHVHLDNLVCQTGASRFGQLNPGWRYNKSDHLTPGSKEMEGFTHLLVDMSSDYSVYKSTHTVLFTVSGLSHVELTSRPPFVSVAVSPKVVALERRRTAASGGSGGG